MKTRTVSTKAKDYVKYKMEGMTSKDAALKAGYSKSTADNTKALIEDRLPATMNEAMMTIGVTNVTLARMIKHGMSEASKPFGSVNNYIDYPDYATRWRYTDTALKLMRLYPDETVQVNQDTTFHVELTESKKPVVVIQDKGVDEKKI